MKDTPEWAVLKALGVRPSGCTGSRPLEHLSRNAAMRWLSRYATGEERAEALVQPGSASSWAESLAAEAPKDSGVHHRAFDIPPSVRPPCRQDRVFDEWWLRVKRLGQSSHEVHLPFTRPPKPPTSPPSRPGTPPPPPGPATRTPPELYRSSPPRKASSQPVRQAISGQSGDFHMDVKKEGWIQIRWNRATITMSMPL